MLLSIHRLHEFPQGRVERVYANRRVAMRAVSLISNRQHLVFSNPKWLQVVRTHSV